MHSYLNLTSWISVFVALLGSTGVSDESSYVYMVFSNVRSPTVWPQIMHIKYSSIHYLYVSAVNIIHYILRLEFLTFLWLNVVHGYIDGQDDSLAA
jgi:hypothetical protein